MKIRTQPIEKYKDYRGHKIFVSDWAKDKKALQRMVLESEYLELSLQDKNEFKDFLDSYDYSLFAAGKESIKINETVIEIEK